MASLTFQNIEYIPSIHQRMVFADEVRRAVADRPPACIAVELPLCLKQFIIRGVMSLPRITAVVYPSNRSEGEMNFIPIDPSDSLIEAVRLGIEHNIPIHWIDREADEPTPEANLPDDWMIERVGLEKYVETILAHLERKHGMPDSDREQSERRERSMARRLVRLARAQPSVLCVLGLAHFPAVRRLAAEFWDKPLADADPKPQSVPGAFLTRVNAESIPELIREIPHIAAQRERIVGDSSEDEINRFDKLAALRTTLKLAERAYRDRYREQVNFTQSKAIFQFMRNLALISGRLQPDVYDLTMAAKGCVDGDFGYEVFELARSWPFQDEESSLPEFTMRRGRGSFSDRDEKFTMTSHFGERSTELLSLRFRRRPSIQLKQQWKEDWDQTFMGGICSWPPEDERQEKFMTFLRNRALQVVGEDKKQVVEFTTSMFDGLDIRETMRNWHTKKIYVKQTPQPQGQVGAVVLIFDDESFDPRYPWRCTLYAENSNESDITFYATALGGDVVGPRITRIEFGGLLSVYPASRIPDIWSFPGIEGLKSHAETLLAAGILFSAHKFIAHIARKPPGSFIRDLAARHKRHIIHLPMRGFSPGQLKKIRRFHILGGHEVRAFAADYIFDR